MATLLERIKDVKRKKKVIKEARAAATLSNLDNLVTVMMLQHGSVVREISMLTQEAHKAGLSLTGIYNDDYFLCGNGGVIFRIGEFGILVLPDSVRVYRLANADYWEGAIEEMVYYGSLTCMDNNCILRKHMADIALYKRITTLLMNFNPRGLFEIFRDVVTPQLVEIEEEYALSC